MQNHIRTWTTVAPLAQCASVVFTSSEWTCDTRSTTWSRLPSGQLALCESKSNSPSNRRLEWPGTHIYGGCDCDFDSDSHEWSCSHDARRFPLVHPSVTRQAARPSHTRQTPCEQNPLHPSVHRQEPTLLRQGEQPAHRGAGREPGTAAGQGEDHVNGWEDSGTTVGPLSQPPVWPQFGRKHDIIQVAQGRFGQFPPQCEFGTTSPYYTIRINKSYIRFSFARFSLSIFHFALFSSPFPCFSHFPPSLPPLFCFICLLHLLPFSFSFASSLINRSTSLFRLPLPFLPFLHIIISLSSRFLHSYSLTLTHLALPRADVGAAAYNRHGQTVRVRTDQ